MSAPNESGDPEPVYYNSEGGEDALHSIPIESDEPPLSCDEAGQRAVRASGWCERREAALRQYVIGNDRYYPSRAEFDQIRREFGRLGDPARVDAGCVSQLRCVGPRKIMDFVKRYDGLEMTSAQRGVNTITRHFALVSIPFGGGRRVVTKVVSFATTGQTAANTAHVLAHIYDDHICHERGGWEQTEGGADEH